MSIKNVIEIPMVPYRLSDATITDKGQYMLFTSLATNDSPGMASFDSQDFNVANGKVSIGTNYPFRGEKKRLLASDANGVNTTDLEYDTSAKGDAIVQRDAAGHVLVPKKTNNESAAISFAQAKELSAHDLASVRDELAAKLDKTTEPNVVYGTDYLGNQMRISVHPSVKPGAIVARDTLTGDVRVPYTPEYPQAATSRDYVDGLCTALGKRIYSLEGATLKHIEDNSPSFIGWTKVSPVGIGTPAFLKYIEGRTERVAAYSSKNLLNPKLLKFGDDFDSYVYNDDGTITYTVSNYAEISFALGTVGLEPGVYYVYVEGGWADLWGDGVSISCEADESEEIMDYVPTIRTLKVMIYKDDSDTSGEWNTIEAPEGTVFEPYAEPTYSLVHRKPMQVLSYSANLFGGGALLDAFLTNYPDSVTVNYANETITLKAGVYNIPVPEIVRRQNGPSIRFIVKGQGGFRWSADGAELEIGNEASPETQISTWSQGNPMHMIEIDVHSDSTIYYEKCGTFILSYHSTGMEVSDVSDFQSYSEEPVGEFFLPEIADFNLGVGVAEYRNSFAWNEKFFVATEKAREIVLNGSEDWKGSAIGTDRAYFYLKVGDSGDVVNLKITSDIYPTATISSNNNNLGIYITNSSTGEARILIRPENVKSISLNKFKDMLAENPVSAVYALTKPNTIVEDVENVSNEIDTCPYSIFRFFDTDGAEMNDITNTIAYVVRRGGVNNVDG